MWHAGPELDAWLMRNIFRRLVCFDSESKAYQTYVKDVGMVDIPKFSTERDDAMILVDYWRSLGYEFKLRRPALLTSFKAMFCHHEDDPPSDFVKADTESLVICLASVSAFERGAR